MPATNDSLRSWENPEDTGSTAVGLSVAVYGGAVYRVSPTGSSSA